SADQLRSLREHQFLSEEQYQRSLTQMRDFLKSIDNLPSELRKNQKTIVFLLLHKWSSLTK
ncbi:MAG: hypothetical protein NZ480_01325, partial [Bdellovibrionaceae bacterium]|nr:hypothetical protein [Pseudobdellovibrionaceae bacterium]